MSSKQGPRFAGMRTAANAASRRRDAACKPISMEEAAK